MTKIKKCPRFARTPKRCCYTCDDRACRGRSPCRACVVAQWERPLMRTCWSKPWLKQQRDTIM